MGVPIPTTRITIERESRPVPYEPATWAPVVAAVPAHFSAVQAIAGTAAGIEQSTETAILLCDECDLRANDRVTDEMTGAIWTVQGVPLDRAPLFGFGGHVKAGVRRVTEAVE